MNASNTGCAIATPKNQPYADAILGRQNNTLERLENAILRIEHSANRFTGEEPKDPEVRGESPVAPFFLSRFSSSVDMIERLLVRAENISSRLEANV